MYLVGESDRSMFIGPRIARHVFMSRSARPDYPTSHVRWNNHVYLTICYRKRDRTSMKKSAAGFGKRRWQEGIAKNGLF